MSEDCPCRMMHPIHDSGTNDTLSSKQVDFVETKMINHHSSLPIVVVTRSIQAIGMSAPTLPVKIDKYFIYEVLIDGKSRVNIMTYETMKRLGLINLESIHLLFDLLINEGSN